MNISLNFTDYQHLENSSLFRSLGVESLASYLGSCSVREIEAETLLLKPGTGNSSIYILLAGALRVYLDGPDMPVHAVLGPGECVGEMSLIDGQPVSALVLAETLCRLLVIPHEVVWAMVDSSHGVARNLLAILSGRMRHNNLTLVANQSRSLEFEQTSSVDVLTGLHNRRWLESALPRVLNRCDRDGYAVCLVVVDVDSLAAFNERYGHVKGDAALRQIALNLADGLRAQDLIGRYGADEFIILLPRTEIDEGMLIAERLRDLANNAAPAVTGGEQSFTVSCGVAAHARGEGLEHLLLRAESALRQARDNGGDRVEVIG